jgi:hypothetical protein
MATLTQHQQSAGEEETTEPLPTNEGNSSPEKVIISSHLVTKDKIIKEEKSEIVLGTEIITTSKNSNNSSSSSIKQTKGGCEVKVNQQSPGVGSNKILEGQIVSPITPAVMGLTSENAAASSPGNGPYGGFGLIQSAAAARAAWLLLNGGAGGGGPGGVMSHPQIGGQFGSHGIHPFLGGSGSINGNGGLGGGGPNHGFIHGGSPPLSGSTASTYWRM